MEYVFLPHCKMRMDERKISEELVRDSLSNPDQVIKCGERIIFHKKYIDKYKGNKEVLLRIITEGKDIITVYKTSKIKKYWRKNHEN